MAVKHRAGIRQKVVMIICLSTLSVMSIAVAIGYFLGFSLSNDMMGDVHRKLSQQLAGNIGKIIDEEIIKIISYSKNFSGYIAGSDAAANLKAIISADRNIAEASLLDERGNLIGSSGKPKKFIKNKKYPDISIENMEFDEVLNTWVIPIAVQVKNENNSDIAVFMAKAATERLFSSLSDFRIDKTGRAILVDGKGSVMFHLGVLQLNVPLCSDRDYRHLLTSKGRYGAIKSQGTYKGKSIFMAFSEVNSRVLSENNITWRVFIEQDAREVFAPLNRFILWVILAVVFLIVVMIPIGFVFSGIIVRPIQQLHGVVGQIIKGNWNYSINVKTGDEIEEFADTFNKMVVDIKDKQEKLVKARNELEGLSKDLENKVRERTAELTSAKDELNLYTKKLERALMIKSDFISMASHELRTPLTAIKEGVDIISKGKAGDVTEKQKEFLDIAKRNVDRLSRFINDILDLQKLEQGKMVFKMEKNDINTVIKEVTDTMRPLAENKKLSLVVSLDKDLPLVSFDKDKITQVMTNLINNAIKFTDSGTISVNTRLDKDFIQTSVSDTGPGIKEKDVASLFKKFIQLEEGLEREHAGTGLGLVICKYMIENHRGRIWAESRPGNGAIFHFILPVGEWRT